MLQQYLTTFHPSGGASPSRASTATNLVTPAAAAAAATIRHESPLPTEIIATTLPHPPPPPLQQQVAAAATGVGSVGVGAVQTNPYDNLTELPVPIFSTSNNNALPATFSALLDEYQHHGHWRYKNIKGRKMQWSHGEKFALSKRLYLYDYIERAAQAMGNRNDSPYRNQAWPVRLDAAAVVLDQKYMDKSLDQAMRAMKAADHTVKPRRKRCRTAEMSADTTTAPVAP
jgi:hypothetical protein